MATKKIIITKHSLVPGKVPTELRTGELAINLADKKVYSFDGTNIITVIDNDAISLIESISVNNVELAIINNNVNIDLSDYKLKSDESIIVIEPNW